MRIVSRVLTRVGEFVHKSQKVQGKHYLRTNLPTNQSLLDWRAHPLKQNLQKKGETGGHCSHRASSSKSWTSISQALANVWTKLSSCFHLPSPEVDCMIGTCCSRRVSYPPQIMYLFILFYLFVRLRRRHMEAANGERKS